MDIKFDQTYLKDYVEDKDFKSILPQIEKAHRDLEDKTGAGNEFLGWMDLPTRIEDSFLDELQKFGAEIPRYKLWHTVKAGLTGWAQINGWRGDTSVKKRLEHDLDYIENWSPQLDLKIIWQTLKGGFLNHNES